MATDPNVDANVAHQIYVERLAKTNANKLDPELKKLANYLRARLAMEGTRIPSKVAMNRVVKDVRKKFGATYDKWIKETDGFLVGLTNYETKYQTGIVDASTKPTYAAIKPTNKSTRALVKNTPMAIGANGGAVALKNLTGNFSKNETEKAIALIESGYYQGLATNDISASIAGTRKNGFEDGIMAGTKRAATAVSRTGSDHVTNTVKVKVYKGNERAVKGYILTAVLDSKTSKICRGLDDTRIDFNDDYQPKPPFHFNCRTVMRPWLRSDLDAVSGAERQTIGADGKAFEPTKKQYYTWLEEQPAWFQDDVLGETEGAIFRNAGLTPSEFKRATITRSGQPLTLDEMAAGDKRIAEYLSK